MNVPPIDTNVIVRYLTETEDTIASRFAGIYPFFGRLESGEGYAYLPDLVLFQTYFVLTSYYGVPRNLAAGKLKTLVGFSGIKMDSKAIIIACLGKLEERSLDLVDTYLLAWNESKGIGGVYSFDSDLEKNGLACLPVC